LFQVESHLLTGDFSKPHFICKLAPKIWREKIGGKNLAPKNLAGKNWRQKFGGKNLAAKIWREKIGG
jgi:hypothetical protein